MTMLNFSRLKADFPLLANKIGDQSLVYLDSAATSQKPQVVIDAISHYYQTANANIHRGVHHLSDDSTRIWHQSRQQIAQFLGARESELIVTRNTTEAINGVAYGWADHHLQPNDVVLISVMEHHSNVVAWQQACHRHQARLAHFKLTPEGRLDLDDFTQKLTNLPVKLIAITHVSNTLGTLNPIDQIREIVNKSSQKRLTKATHPTSHHFTSSMARPKLLLDAAQSVPHLPINFEQLGVDFLVFSGHKMLGPMGVGGLIVAQELLDSQEFQPWLFGGGMISEVSQLTTVFHPDPSDRFVAGTPDVASVVGLAAAFNYLQSIGMSRVADHDQELVNLTISQLTRLPEVKVIGPTQPLTNATKLDRVGSVSFVYRGVHAHDVAQILDSQGIAVRSGHHCTMPLHQYFGWTATVRASFQVYNDESDIAALVKGLEKVKQVFLV